ncbi:PLP-dependent aminotransferase family protein [Fictibacillus phosphorivorans]|uniref:aminotransferase-like domain-containing protein n=1 Tax=Fictibacillus phosphorivorans TaxID=1221500 RepID=UPI00203EF76C|nr:PLP-dependent aminotransferase family protein [Fictibacillus phosphorivorans]MCM3718984.1 PLP-dependent aminotransferase family protein [Fictibacillus phosphorivorans]MCM3776606.1 PLP-dependent aminotransferase family protein [Fictibacillus phosphorivorans]
MLTKYEEVIIEIKNRIEEGHIMPGERLPSVRALSKELQCSVNSILKAYAELEKEHKIYPVPKSGYFLVGRTPPVQEKQPDLIDFLSAGPDRSRMPYRDYQHCMNQAIEFYKEEMFQYSEPLGLFTLRRQLSKQLQNLQVFAPPERIAVVSGSQQALDLLITLPFPNGKEVICVEQPTHFSFIESITSRGLEAVGIEMTKDGIDLEHLEEIFKTQRIKFFYTVSRFQNPTGYSYSNHEKKRMVQLAQKYDVYIIEDDYMGDLDTRRKADPMFAYDPSGRVIYTKSFSKVLLPGLRLGVAVLPNWMIENFTKAKFAADVHTPVLTQGALEIYLKSGMYSAHIQKLRKQYKTKGKILKHAYLEHLPKGTSFSGGDSGFYSTVKLPGRLKPRHLIKHLKKKNVLVQDATNMYLTPYRKENQIRLSVSQVEDSLISIGVQRIGEGIRELLLKM